MYKQSKIYKITDDENNIYIGSTTQKYLSSRLQQHKAHTKKNRITTNKLVNPDTWNIQLLEQFECNDINELRTKERQYIENNNCINKNIPTRTQKERNKIFYDENKQIELDRKTKYYYENKDLCLEQRKKYYNENSNKIIEYSKNYQQKIITCECGAVIKQGGILRHKKTKKHQSFYK